MADIFMYVVDRDFGFAPNPFHGYCTLATCKPAIRKSAAIGDWVIGTGGSRLHATGRCIFAMKVTDKASFNEYWVQPRYRDKRPIRNGSYTAMVGDNIYHRDPKNATWHQADSHHSHPDGQPNTYNLANDTKADAVLISRMFFYFGRTAPTIPTELLQRIGFKNCRSHRRFNEQDASVLIQWLFDNYGDSLNLVEGDPFDFAPKREALFWEDKQDRVGGCD